MSTLAPPPPARRLSSRPSRSGTAAWLVILALLLLGLWAIGDLRINLATLVDSGHNAVDFAGRTFPLDFPPPDELLALCGTTLAIMVSATVLSVLISVPLAVFAATNTTPLAVARPAARGLIVLARAVPEVVLAIACFRIFGLGATTGVLAMGLHSVGMLGKLFADAIEQIDEGPRLAVRATGAGRLQELLVGVLPQVAPAFVAVTLHRLDINLRVSVVLGFVGVNGLGYAIATAVQELDYPRGMALALLVLLLCVLVELLSGTIRRALLHNSPAPVTEAVAARPGRLSPGWTARRMRRNGYAALTALVVLASAWGADPSPAQFFGSLEHVGQAAQLFWPPGTGGILGTLLADLLDTVKIALAATVLGATLALPIGALAARNVAPSGRLAQGFRMGIVLVRGVPELILGIVFVVITGLGAVAGTLALCVGTIGLLGKLVADSLEEVDPGVEAAVRATGASRWQVFGAATLPRAAPAIVAHVLYQLDVNIRSATLLGIVGAGGIGFDLVNAARSLIIGVPGTILLLVFGTVLMVELLALWLRRVVR